MHIRLLSHHAENFLGQALGKQVHYLAIEAAPAPKLMQTAAVHKASHLSVQ